MRQTIFMLCLFPLAAAAYNLMGVWRVSKMENVLFTIDSSHVKVAMGDESSLKMVIKHKTDDYIEFDSISVLKKPKDWYNVSKYKKYIGWYKTLKTERIYCHYTFHDQDRLLIKSGIKDSDEHLATFLLKRDYIFNSS